MRTPRAFIEQAAFGKAVARAEQKLRAAGRVVRVRHVLEHDMDGTPVVWFRVVLPDASVTRHKLLEAIDDVSFRLRREIQPQTKWDVYPHFSFRSKSEQDSMQEPAWA